LTYTLGPGAPAGATISPLGVISWTPSAGTAENISIPVVVSDGISATLQGIPVRIAPEPIINSLVYDPVASVMEVRFPSLSGVLYRLDCSPEIDVPAWTPVTNGSAIGSTFILPHPVGSELRMMYRVILLPTP